VRSVNGAKTLADPLAGVQFRTPENGNRWHAEVYTEIGGFGAGSTSIWRVFPTVGVDLTRRVSLEFGCRWLDIVQSSGEGPMLFKHDRLAQGPTGGFGFKV
jgi:hypothetical protein